MIGAMGPLGMALRGALMPKDDQIQMPQAQPQGLSKGQLIMGVLADALAGAQGREGAFAAQMGQQRKQAEERAQWGLKRQADLQDYEAKQQIEQRYRQPDVSPMVRDAQAYMGMTPEQRTAYGQMKQAGAGDPDVFITLPNGQVYAGPKSGLAAAMMGGGAPTAPAAPVGKLRPVGGQTPPASGVFR